MKTPGGITGKGFANGICAAIAKDGQKALMN
jgi:hypothetical protein